MSDFMTIIIIPYTVCLYMEAAPNNLGYIIKNSNGLELTVASTSNGVVLQMVVNTVNCMCFWQFHYLLYIGSYPARQYMETFTHWWSSSCQTKNIAQWCDLLHEGFVNWTHPCDRRPNATSTISTGTVSNCFYICSSITLLAN